MYNLNLQDDHYEQPNAQSKKGSDAARIKARQARRKGDLPPQQNGGAGKFKQARLAIPAASAGMTPQLKQKWGKK
jgi:hypothetical protein